MRFDFTHATPESLPIIVILAALTLFSAAAIADDDERWQGGESKQKYRDGPCKVEEETKKSGEYKRKTECRDGGAAAQNGEWKREFRDGPCKVKQEAKHDRFKEEVECKGRK